MVVALGVEETDGLPGLLDQNPGMGLGRQVGLPVAGDVDMTLVKPHTRISMRLFPGTTRGRLLRVCGQMETSTMTSRLGWRRGPPPDRA